MRLLLGLMASAILAGTTHAQLAAATLPQARTVSPGNTATFFATIINTDETSRENCSVRIAAGTQRSASLDYQLTDATNTPFGNANTPFDLGSGASQTLVLAITPDDDTYSYRFPLDYVCDGITQPSTFELNDLGVTVSAQGTTPPDIITTMVTLSGDGVVRSQNDRRGVAAGSLVNIGGAGPITLQVGLPLSYFSRWVEFEDRLVCLTDTQARCIDPPASSVSVNIAADEVLTFNVYIQDNPDTAAAFFPELNRVSLVAISPLAGFPQYPTIAVGRSSVAYTDPGPGDRETRGYHGVGNGYFGDSSDALANQIHSVITADGHVFLTSEFNNIGLNDYSDSFLLYGQPQATDNGLTIDLTGPATRVTNGTDTDLSSFDGSRIHRIESLRGRPEGLNGQRLRINHLRNFDAYPTQIIGDRNDLPARHFRLSSMRRTPNNRLYGNIQSGLESTSLTSLAINDDINVYENLTVGGSILGNCSLALAFSANPDVGGRPAHTFAATLTLSECPESGDDLDGSYTGTALSYHVQEEGIYNGVTGACAWFLPLFRESDDFFLPLYLEATTPSCYIP